MFSLIRGEAHYCCPQDPLVVWIRWNCEMPGPVCKYKKRHCKNTSAGMQGLPMQVTIIEEGLYTQEVGHVYLNIIDVVGDKPDACMIQVDKSAVQGQGCQ